MDLGKYAVTVVGAWGVTLLLLAGLVVQTLLAARRARADLERAEATAPQRREGPRHG